MSSGVMDANMPWNNAKSARGTEGAWGAGRCVPGRCASCGALPGQSGGCGNATAWCVHDRVTFSANTTNSAPVPPTETGYRAAVYTRRAWADFEASFEYAHRMTATAALFVFGAASAADYYAVALPANEIASAEEYTSLFVFRVDASGWARALHRERLSGVSSACCGLWHSVTVNMTAGVLRVTVDEQPATPIELRDTAKPRRFTRPGHA